MTINGKRCCFTLAHEPIRDISSGNFRASSDLQDGSRLNAIVPHNRICALNPRELARLQMIPRKKVLFLLFGEWFVFWNKFVLGDVDENLFQVETFDDDGFPEAFEVLTHNGGHVVKA